VYRKDYRQLEKNNSMIKQISVNNNYRQRYNPTTRHGAADTRFLPDNFIGPLIYEVYEQSN